jgi:hypothetical protein
MWFNGKHLEDASIASSKKLGYFSHLVISLEESIFCLLMTLGSIIHALFPWVLDFKLIEWRVNRLKSLKHKFPDDPILKKVHFDD